MIGKLKGTLDEIGEDYCTVDVHGVGYVVHCSVRTLAQLPGPGEAVTLHIETYVREDMIRLYGFQSALEREWFRLLHEQRARASAPRSRWRSCRRSRRPTSPTRSRCATSRRSAARPASARRSPSASSPS